MFEVMNESSGNVLGIKAIGIVRRADYDVLTPLCESLIEQEGTIRVLIDMQDFDLEEPTAWGADLHLGHEMHNKIEKMAIVGNRRWEQWMTSFCSPFYAREAKYFRAEDMADAWNWLEESKEQAA